MGLLFVIYYDQTPDSRFFLCKTCGTHIAEDKTDQSTMEGENMLVDTPEHHYKDDSFGVDMELADVHCVGCNMIMGKKIIQMESSHGEFREGIVVPITKNLLYWNGEQIIDAITAFPSPEDV